MKKTITLLGATGKVGSKIASILLQEGHHLKLIAKTSENLQKFKNIGADIISADITDVAVLTNAFQNSDSAYVMTPPDFTSNNYRAFQRKVGDAVIAAIQNSGIKYVVNLSSAGAHQHEGNGLIAGLAEQDVKLNQLQDVNILHLRPAYFLDNALLNISLIKQMGIYLNQPAEVNFAHTARQTYIALGLALAQAAELKVDTTPVEGFDNNVVDKVLDLEKWGLKSVSLMYVGYADPERDWLSKMKKVRVPKEELVIEFK